MKHPTCSDCRAYAPLTRECRRHAPIAVPVPHAGGMAAIGIFPATDADKWCEEFVAQDVLVSTH